MYLKITRGIRINIGSLGVLNFKRGLYAYVGSAFGPGGFGGRLRRHLTLSQVKDGKTRWHIDLILANRYSKVIGFHIMNGVACEHRVARRIGGLAYSYSRGMGSTDCKCPSHFFCLGNDIKSINVIGSLLQKSRIARSVTFTPVSSYEVYMKVTNHMSRV